MDFKFSDIARIAAARWRTIAAWAVALTGLAILVSLLAPATYQTTAVVLVKANQVIETRGEQLAAPPPGQFEQQINSLAHLLRSDDVLQTAITAFGAEKLFPNLSPRRWSDRFWDLRHSLRHDTGLSRDAMPAAERTDMAERITQMVRKSLTVGVEPKTNLISVTFSHGDRHVVADFTNTLLKIFRTKSTEQGVRDEIATFMGDQKKLYDQAYETKVKRLADYSEKNAIFSIIEQRRMMLERESAMLTASQLTTTTIVDKQNQAAELSGQLKTIYPLAKYPQIDQIVQAASGAAGRKHQPRTTPAPETNYAPNDSKVPLLLIRVYQDTIQALVKLQSEIAGQIALKEQQVKDIAAIRVDLQQLAQKSSTFERMQLEAQQAREAAEQYSSSATKERLKAEASRQGLSILDVVQPAPAPFDPIFPNPFLLIPFGLIAGAGLGFALALARDRWNIGAPFAARLKPDEWSLQWPKAVPAADAERAIDTAVIATPQPLRSGQKA